MNTTRTQPSDDVLGYTLQSRIGSGAFGEVWRAEAPGGLLKAVKIVFGYHDDARARRELKALNTVKGLRHPFLLSLERIEVCDGQLIVVTELADSSLKDRYADCISQGLPGIPRDELLSYLRDAADGLDFLCNKHLLQHLDVKPENLLLVGGHVKVADYGLVKDIRECTQSIMGGMTPTYAAPELFDGRPSQLSDQYSLAIVFQEMLTGVRPFEGKTPAQLARQHLSGHPNLDPLPRGDQAVVARALSKEPSNRFASCTLFMEELTRRRKNASPPKPRAKADAGHDDEETPSHGVTRVLSDSDLPTKRNNRAAQRLPAIECDGSAAAFHPTLLIGVGLTGAVCLERLKRRFFQRFGRSDELPAVHILCLDTDQKDLSRVTNRDERTCFRDQEVLSIQLKNADAYRKVSHRFSSWLSRRWIYNIPRSLTTEGIRPLGRLAFADHSVTILDQLHGIVQSLSDSASAQQSAQTVDLPVSETPRVFIVGSISGGLGSGMIADLAYAVRTVLLEHGLSDEHITGMLLHGSGKSLSDAGLATANTYACLRELAHYAKLGYPGDESLGLPQFDEDEPSAFNNLYVLDCGTDDFAYHASVVADYLYLDVATGCNDFFKRCRGGRNEDGKLSLRSMGLSRIDLQAEKIIARFSAFLQERLFTTWLQEDDSAEPSFDATQFAADEMEAAQISLDTIVRTGRVIGEAVYGKGLREQLLQLAQTTVKRDPGQDHQMAVHSAIDQYFAARDAERAGSHRSDLMAQASENMFGATLARIAELIDRPDAGLASAKKAHQECQRLLEDIRLHIAEKIQSTRQQHAPEADESQQPLDLEKVVELRVTEATLSCGEQLTRNLNESSHALAQELKTTTELLETSRQLAGNNCLGTDDEHSFGSAIGRLLDQYLPSLVVDLDERIHQGYFKNLGGLRCVTADGLHNAKSLAEALQVESRRMVADRFKQLDLDGVLDTVEPTEKPVMLMLQQHLRDALPRLRDCGGSVRLLLATPPATAGKRLGENAQRLFKQSPSIVHATDGDIAVCFEGQDVSAETFGLRLLEENPAAAEYVDRIKSRLDVEWMPLTGLG